MVEDRQEAVAGLLLPALLQQRAAAGGSLPGVHAGRCRDPGGQGLGDTEEAVSSLRACLDKLGVPYKFNPAVKRGLSYYVEDGFEAEVESLGAQKQVAGGGRYAEGIGWAIGVDRMMLAIQTSQITSESPSR